MPLNSPVSAEKIERLIQSIELSPDSRAVDFGCGAGDFLLDLNAASGANCLGIDIDASLVDAANRKLAQSALTNIEFRVSDVTGASLGTKEFDLAACMGSSHAFSEGEPAYTTALGSMQKLLKPNGMILIGEGYWKREPDPEYLAFLGDPVGIYRTHEENITAAESVGLVPIYATESNLDEWDHFEWSFLIKAEREAIASPGDEGTQNKLKRVREWNAVYRKYGRNTMGYGHYIFMQK